MRVFFLYFLEYFLTKNLPDGRLILSYFGSLCGFGQSTHGFGRKFQFQATETLGLDIDLESATGMTFGMTDFVTSFGSASSQITGSAHKIVLNSYKNQSIIPVHKCQSSNFKYQIKLKWRVFGNWDFGSHLAFVILIL